ncbi:hypothetical protein [Singulisphaera sp. GP187]|uniref:hypothetical protein n=1 Tax=Singulisphaera sp. GP187 TaxID=1882752 RepID=UPI000941803C|nr:hypothetical protein [Singulisphaera sp. GP187]
MTIDCSKALPNRHRRLPGWLWARLLIPIALLGAGPPEAVRIRVPAERVGTWFPHGTELRGLSAEQFDALLASARAGYQRLAGGAPARLLQARHSARWNAGLLVGSSVLVIDAPSGKGPYELILSPWTAAIEPAEAATTRLRMHDDGRTAVRVEAGTVSTVTLKWQLRARTGSQGRRFTLGLPDTETSRLTLDLPEDWIPEGATGIRQGPDPGSEPGRKTWRFEGRGGPIDLQLHGRRSDQGANQEPRAWVSGPTRVELGEALAHWTMDWLVDLEPHAPRRFQVELDRGLEFASVTGPGIDESRAEVIGEVTRVTVLLNDQVAAPTRVTFRAVARIPAEGPWPVPAARPLDALWTGGRTSIRLDPSRLLRDCREAAGRRVPARPTGDQADPNLIVFEAEAPQSVAVLTFGKPRVDVSVEVRGQLLLGNSSPRLESQLTWRVHRGHLLALDVDLPPAWVPERVQVVGIDEPLAWHPRTLPGGGVRVHVTPPSGDFTRSSLVLNLTASAAIAGGRGPITLPRVRPVGVQVVDERWLAWTESGVTLHPAKATGLAWIDPSLVIGPTNDRPAMPAGLREALAWRWISDQAEARVNRERVQEEPRGSIQLLASIDRDRLRLDWRISVDAGEEPLRSIPLVLPDPIQGAGDWHFTNEVSSVELPRKPIDPARRAELGLPESGQAWELVLPDAPSGPVVVHSRLEVPWDGRGRLPLLVMPDRFRSRHFAIVDVARQLQASVESSGLQDLEPAVAEEAIRIGNRRAGRDNLKVAADPVPRRRAYAFSYTKPGGRLEVRTEALEPASSEGVIDHSILTTFVDPQGPLRHRLALRVTIADARTLDLTLPQGSTLVRVKRDGQPVAPSRNARGHSLPLPSPTSSRNACTFVLDYQTPRRASAADQDYRPERPLASLTYLAFRWEVVVPEPWLVAEHGPSLTASDPASAPTGLRRFLPPWRWSRKGELKHDADVLRSLDQQAAETTLNEMTLGECFTRWDASPVPIVIDRMTLESGGWGPRSRVSPPHNDRNRAGAASAVIGPLGLSLVPIGEAVLVTTRVEAPDRPGGPLRDAEARAAWEARIREAVVNGSDVSDRFQTVARWRGESARKSQYGSETTDIDPSPNGRRTWRFSAVGWPESGMTIHLVDEQHERATAWAAGLAVLAIGIACRGIAPHRRALGLAVVLLGSGVGLVMTAPRPAAIAAGGATGALAVFFYGLGSAIPAWPRRRNRNRDSRPSSSPRLRSGSGVITALVGCSVFLAGADSVRLLAAAGDDTPVVALYPFEGAADPARIPNQAVIRLEDYTRLKTLADLTRQEPNPGVEALAATHRIAWQGAGGVVIESEIDLTLEGARPALWTFPVGHARDITAALDDVEIPVQVQSGGQVASVTIAGAGRKPLRIRRFVTPRRLDDAESISLPINPLASARVEVGPGPAGRRIEVPNARGALTPWASGSAGALGPVDRLEVRWVSNNEQERIPAVGSVEGLLLWDAEPAGDRLRARLTYRKPEGTSVIRLRLDPGLVVRSLAIPGQADASLQSTEKGVEWVAHINPPLPDGAAIRLEFWRPHPIGQELTDELPTRTLPRIEPLGAETYSGAIGFRRPAEWAGRLAALAGSDPITEEVFVRSWGNLPEEPLTLSGVTRFLRPSSVSVRTGLQPARLSVQPTVELNLGPGRVEVSLEAKLTQVSGRSYQVEFDVPSELQVTRVEGDGVTDWSRSSGRIQLRFDGASAKQRTVRVLGWLPVPYDPLATGTTRQEVGVPWPRWQNVEISPGSLGITAPMTFQLETAAGVTPSNPDFEDLSLTTVRTTYRVDRPEGLGRLRWEVEPPRVDVQVRSQLTINPDSAEWVAVLRYDVSGGACDSIQLKLPTVWAQSAEVTLAGGSHQLTSESRKESTVLTIRPEQPIWGSQDVTIRSVRSLAQTSTLFFPVLEPSVNGTTESDLAIVNASGREFSTEGSPSLQPIDDSSRFQTEEFSPLPGLPTSVFRVKSKGWSLKVDAPGGTLLARDLGSGHIRAALTEIEGVVREDGSTLGSMRCLIENRTGPFFPFSLPAGSKPVWVSVGGRPTRPLRAASGRWLIPLEEADSDELTMVWVSKPTVAPKPGEGRLIPYPGLDQERSSTFLSLRIPASWDTTSRSPVFAAVAPDRQDISRAEKHGRLIADRLATIDRSSLRDRESLVASLVEFELMLRSAERAAVWESPLPSATRETEIRVIQARVQAARHGLAEAVETAALDELARAARVHLGLAREDAAAATPELAEPAVPVRLRRLGQPRRFDGDLDGAGKAPVLVGTSKPSTWLSESEQAAGFVWAAVALPPLVWGLTRRTGRSNNLTSVLLLAATLAVTALSGGLGIFLAALFMAGLGWLFPDA